MSSSDKTTATHTAAWPDPLGLTHAAAEYLQDAWQRTVLYADIRRQRGDQYQAHLQEETPNVLSFPSKLVMSGFDLPQPVNYGMVRITPPADQPVDDTKRPFVVIDPRAGHGPGIGGFKPDSEIGAAMRAGHPCYFVGFLPDPVPGQTVEDVMRADAAFVKKAAELHPASRGKPAVIGNCQAGWQVLMAASLWPDLFGPIIVAGSPLSYWAGNNPMRYVGGMLGGSWLTAMTSDLGDGRFDGAWLVKNFENLDPANTLWAKQYNVYAKVDTEGPRYLEFEKYWGGYVYLNDVEIQYIVDNLFIGNKLASGELMTSDGLRIDLRNIRSPIVVFCSYGDNITPPPQALGWITDLYQNDADVLSHNQTIIYATHDSIGHLGIFVSSSVGRKEHQEFAAHIDLIDLIPPGIYQATVLDNPEASEDGDPYRTSIRRANVQDVRDIVKPDAESERRFEAAARVSDINLALYRSFVQPWVRAFASPETATQLQNMHPLRVGYERWSSTQPWAHVVQAAAEQIREHRQTVASDNPFLALQQVFSDLTVQNLNTYRDLRDQHYANAFEMIYGSPWVQALAGRALNDDSPARPRPGDTPEHRAFVQQQMAQLQREIHQGDVLEVGIRALLYTFRKRGRTDAHCFRLTMQLRPPAFAQGVDFARFKTIIRRQALLLDYDEAGAVAAIPALLKDVPATQIRTLSAMLQVLVCETCQPTPPERAAFDEIQQLLTLAATDSTTPDDSDKTSVNPDTVVSHPAATTGSTSAPAPTRKTAAKKTSPTPRPRTGTATGTGTVAKSRSKGLTASASTAEKTAKTADTVKAKPSRPTAARKTPVRKQSKT